MLLDKLPNKPELKMDLFLIPQILQEMLLLKRREARTNCEDLPPPSSYKLKNLPISIHLEAFQMF